eukprot:TRINITY_DN79643_c0_g1_i1.p1 TRINITY_DN79643_c0_g1~~TRINITY_DN79643_c0_g1_i1.p1  ORF type:complete len:380 (+),score=91.23 TRINITY_DN79643_c0_g1_i1:21-1160(+)
MTLAPTDASPLRRGVLVRIRGLQSAAGAALNGQLGRCDRLDDKTGRWGVLFADGSSKALKAENLFSFDEYLKVAHGGITPVDIGPYMQDFTTNPKYGALPAEAEAVVRYESGSKECSNKPMEPEQELRRAMEKAQRAGRKASPRLSEEEERSGHFSEVVVKKVDLRAGSMEFAVIAPPAPVTAASAESDDVRRPLPTILAISRGDQRHVARLFRALRPEQRGWQLLVAMRCSGEPDFLEPAGAMLLEQFMQAVLEDREAELAPFAVMSRVFHLVGISHGAAGLLQLATKVPEQTGSLSMITGFLPQLCQLQAVRNVQNIHFYVGDRDEMGHREFLKGIRDMLKEAGGHGHMHIVKGASHFDIGEYMDLEEFWRRLELAR